MSLNYIPLYTGIWSDRKFKNLKDNDNRILFIYLFGNPQITLTGIYPLDLDVCRMKIKSLRRFEEVFDENVKSGVIEWDAKEEIVWVVNRFKLIPNKSTKVVIGTIDELNQISHPFRDRFIDRYKEELQPYFWRLKGQKVSVEEICTEDFILNAAKLYTNKKSLKQFMLNRGISEHRIDEIIPRVLPQWTTTS